MVIYVQLHVLCCVRFHDFDEVKDVFRFQITEAVVEEYDIWRMQE